MGYFLRNVVVRVCFVLIPAKELSLDKGLYSLLHVHRLYGEAQLGEGFSHEVLVSQEFPRLHDTYYCCVNYVRPFHNDARASVLILLFGCFELELIYLDFE